jgi:arylsulfatase A-like enzyme
VKADTQEANNCLNQPALAESGQGTKYKVALTPPRQAELHPALLLVSGAVLLCLSLEVGVIEQADSLSLYMTPREIAVDAGIGLLLMIGAAILWWLVVLAIVGVVHLLPPVRRYQVGLGWRLGLLLPFCYLTVNTFGALKEVIFPQWHSDLVVWLLMFGLFSLGILRVRVSRLQEFCRSRMRPILWIHAILAVIALLALRWQGVHRFHSYARPGRAIAASQLPDIYLLTADALSMEDTSLDGYSRTTTPNLERFAQRSYAFQSFFANSNFTDAATTSIETGKLPWSHRVFQQGGFLRGAGRKQNLAELLRERGYYTAMITSNPWAAPFHHRTTDSYDAVEFVVPGGSSGAFFHYTNLVGANTEYTLPAALTKRLARALTYVDSRIWPERYPAPAEGIFEEVRALAERSDIRQPRFVWAHIFPPHDPYLPPPPFRGRFLSTRMEITHPELVALRTTSLPPGVSADELRAQYDEMILYADHALGSFLDWLEATGRLDHAIVIVSADHGESFEHETFLHAGPNLYNSLIRVPLLIHLPGQKTGGRLSELAQQADLLPTILDLIGAPPPTWTDGTSLKPALNGNALPPRPIFSMNLEPARTFGSIAKGTVAVMDDQYKYVLRLDQQQEALYRYRKDRQEQDNLVASDPAVRNRMHDVLLEKLHQVNQGPQGVGADRIAER